MSTGAANRERSSDRPGLPSAVERGVAAMPGAVPAGAWSAAVGRSCGAGAAFFAASAGAGVAESRPVSRSIHFGSRSRPRGEAAASGPAAGHDGPHGATPRSNAERTTPERRGHRSMATSRSSEDSLGRSRRPAGGNAAAPGNVGFPARRVQIILRWRVAPSRAAVGRGLRAGRIVSGSFAPMTTTPQSAAPIVVVGGGLAGLVAAETLVAKSRRRVVIIDPADRPGGVLQTVRRGEWLVERAADCFLAARPEGLALVERLGLTDRLLPVSPSARRAMIWWGGRTVPVPAGFRLLAPGDREAIRTTPLLSAAGRDRLLAEPTVPSRDPAAGDESLESFAVRRLGREAFERLVQPLVAGIWTADPARLSMAAACPEFVRMEREHGSLTAGERARLEATRPGEGQPAPDGPVAGARYSQFVTLAEGMESLPKALWRRLGDAGVEWRRAAVDGLAWSAAGYVLRTAGGSHVQPAAGVVVACPAPIAAPILGDVAPALAGELAAIEHAGSAVVCLGYDRAALEHPLTAAGVVVPAVAGRGCLAISFASAKFPGRAPGDGALVRVFLGGALDPGVALLPDELLIARAAAEAEAILGARRPPRLVEIARWHGAMPQYHLGHVDRVRRIGELAAALPGVALAGNAYEGVGIPQVIASGIAAADAVAGVCG